MTNRAGSFRLGVSLGFAVLLVGVSLFALRGRGVWHRIRTSLGSTSPTLPVTEIVSMPSIAAISPEDTSTGIDPAAPIRIKLDLPNGPLDAKSVTDDSVGLFRFDTRQRIPAKVTIVADGIQATPNGPLEANRNYRIEIPPGLLDVKGRPVKQQTASFFTSAKPPEGVAFEPVELSADAKGEGFTSVNFGPDGKLYASTHDGKLVRFKVATDGTLSDRETFKTIIEAEHGPRLFTGFTFDPTSTADAPVIYLTHSAFGFEEATDWSGKICRLSGPKFEKLEPLVINLPRSARDHATNQPKFGPDGALYIPQPSNTAVGGADAYWKMRDEHLLNDTILRLDVHALEPGKTIDARTPEAGGAFDPYAAGSPLTIFAMGLRMPYDLLWHSNGNLYSGINGASSRGATPAGTSADGVSVPAIPNVQLAEHDWFFKIERGHYYGHPNPIQGHFVLNGGNPTAAPDFNEVSDYPVGTKPDSSWTSALYDFGMHVSADGLCEYRSDRFGGKLKGKIFICRYNIGSDLLCITLAPDGSVGSVVSGIPGTTKLVGPLDVTEDLRNGNLYVVEYHERQASETRITLLRAIGTTP